jgi:hypothetical protein
MEFHANNTNVQDHVQEYFGIAQENLPVAYIPTIIYCMMVLNMNRKHIYNALRSFKSIFLVMGLIELTFVEQAVFRS